MLEIKDILMGAHSCEPALNDFCELVASRLPFRDLATAEMAQIVLDTSFDARRGVDSYCADYPHLRKFIDEGGDMCKLAAKLSTVLAQNASAELADFAKAYQTESVRFFGAV